MAHRSRFIRSLLQLPILCSLVINLAATAAVSNDTASSLQSNGVICSKGFFGSPVFDTCKTQLSRFPKTSDFQWFKSWHDFSYTTAIPGEQCAIEIGILPGARNNVTWNTLTGIASAVVETCSTLPGSPGGWGAYADIYILILEPENSQRDAVEKSGPKDPTDNSPPSAMGTTAAEAAAPTTPVNTADIAVAHEIAYYKGSFWGRLKSAVNTIKASSIRQLPYFNVTEQWQYPAEVYAEYTPEEEGFCTDPPPQCVSDKECCEDASCLFRIVEATLERVCVPIPVDLRAMSSETVVKGETTSTVFHDRPTRRRRRREISGR